MKSFMNKRYTTISIYAVVVFFICMIIYKVVMSWNDSMAFIGSIVKILAPFLIAFLISYFISPMVNVFEQKIMPKFHIGKFKIKKRKTRLFISILLSYLIFTSIVVILILIILPTIGESVTEFIENSNEYTENFSNWIANLSLEFNGKSYHLDTTLISSYVNENLPSTIDQVINLIPDFFEIAKSFASGIINVLVAYIISIYLVASKEKAAVNTKRVVVALFQPKTARNIFETTEYANKVFSSFFIGKMIDSFIIGLLCFIILMIFNFQFALLISVIIGITNMIPYFGPLIGGAIGCVFLLLVSPSQALWFLLIVVILQQFDGNILGPWILGDSVGLSPFWVIFAIIVFGSLFGLIGMFLGAPLLSVIKYMISKPIDTMYRRRTALAIEQGQPKSPID